MKISTILIKIGARLWSAIVQFSRTKKYYPKLYKCYWHTQIFNSSRQNDNHNYYTAIPNQGAGIGHQMSNWIAGYWFAKQFGLQFAHVPFANGSWEHFLGFGEDEQTFEELLAIGYKKVKLPLFDENDSEDEDFVEKKRFFFGKSDVKPVKEKQEKKSRRNRKKEEEDDIWAEHDTKEAEEASSTESKLDDEGEVSDQRKEEDLLSARANFYQKKVDTIQPTVAYSKKSSEEHSEDDLKVMDFNDL